jgi:hypothetical protein
MPDAILNDLASQTQNANAVIPIDDVLGQILGVRLDDDIGRFRSALARAFPVRINALTGTKSVAYIAPSYAVQSLQGGSTPTTGALASIQAQTSLLVAEALTVLARLRPLHCACDAGVESLRGLMRGELEALPALFAQDIAPRSSQINITFLQLTGVGADEDPPASPDPANFNGQIAELGSRLGMSEPARTIDDEEIRTDFRIFVSYVWMLQTAWAAIRDDFDNAGPESLGTSLHRLQRRLLALRYANREVYAALDKARIGAAERMTFLLGSEPAISLADLLAWIDEVASAKGLAVISAGQDGIGTFVPVVQQLLAIVCGELKPLVDGKSVVSSIETPDCDGCADSTFLGTGRLKHAVNKLALQLTELCRETKRALPPPPIVESQRESADANGA